MRHYKPRLVYFLTHVSLHFIIKINTRDNLSSEQGNSSKKSAVYNQERVKMARVRYIEDV